ncbi:MAG: Uma2 family endonuclease, partial [Actinomycetota bacterium]|nr:Uma2 family endonuclease [Actinomycetota bacterium]
MAEVGILHEDDRVELIEGDIVEMTSIGGRHAFCVNELRASVNRSWSSGRSAFPAVAAPAFSDESPDDDDHIREGHPEID